MKKGKCIKFLAGLLCVAVLSSDLASAGILSLAAEVESVQETEMQLQEDKETQEEMPESENFALETETLTENVQTQSAEILEEDTESENQTERENVFKNTEIAEMEMIESEAEDISESELQETQEHVVLGANGYIASGVIDEDYGHITWGIDADGKLTVDGTGDFSTSNSPERAPWYNYCQLIKSAKINVAGITNASYMFCNCSNLTEFTSNNLFTNNIINMEGMFKGCSSLVNLNLNNFSTSNVKTMKDMFCLCSSLVSLNLNNFDTNHVTDMWGMFCDCSSLTNLDLNSFNTNNVITMHLMFYGCSNLTSLDLRNFDTNSVTDMAYMFNGCNNLIDLDLRNFNTNNVIDMHAMFYDCNNLTNLHLRNFNTSNVMDMDMLFGHCNTLKIIHTPKNIIQSVPLPTANDTDIWYRSDGTVVTELPQSLSYSVALGKNYIPTEKQPDLAESAVIELKDGESAVLIYDTETNAPIENASITIDNKTYTTNAKGIAIFSASDNATRKRITVKAPNYNDVLTYKKIKNRSCIRIGMIPDAGSIQITGATASLGNKKFDLLREKYVLGYAESLDNFSNLAKDTLTLEITANKPDVTYELIVTDKGMWTTPNKAENLQTTTLNSSSSGTGEGGGFSGGTGGGGGFGFGFGDDDILFTNTDGKFSIEVGTETVKIGTVDLEQTAVITIQHPTEKMYVRITDKEDHCVVKRLNLFTTHNYLSQEKTSQKDSFKLGNELKVSIPDDIPFIGGGEYTFGFEDKVPVEMEIDEDGKIRIALNKPTDTDMAEFGKIYGDMENEYKNMDKKTHRAMELIGNKHSFDAALLKISGKVCGYGEGNINEIVNRDPVIELGIMAELEGKAGYQQRWVIGVVPIKIFVEASAKGSVDFRTDVKFENWKIKALDFSDGSFNVKIGLEAGAGVGCSYVYEIEVSLNGSLNYINKPGRNYQRIWLEASGKVQRTALYFFEKPLWQSDTYTHTVYERGSDKTRDSMISPMQNAESSTQESSFQIIDRNYLNYAAGYHAQTDVIQLASHNSEEESKNITVKSAVLPTTKATLLDTENGRYLFWADDIASRDSYNRSALMYAKSANGIDWNTPKQLLPEAEDSTLDGYYSVFSEGKNIHILWQDATRQITEEDDLLDVLNALLVRHVVLDTESDTIVKDQCVTQESGCYLYPCAVAAGAELYTAYVQNMLDSGDVDGKNTHRLYVVTPENETKEVSIPQDFQIVNVCSGVFEENPCLVCELDTDGNMDTNTDREIYLYDFQAERLSRITNDSETDTMPVIADSGRIYWFRNGKIMKLSEASQTPSAIWSGEQTISQTAFTVATDQSGKDTILWETVDPDAEDGSVTIFQTKEDNDGNWGNIIKFAETTGTIASSISAADGGNGLQVAHTEGVFLSDGTELKDLCVTAEENTTDIAVTYLDFEEKKAAAGSPLPLNIGIANNGNTTVDEVEVRVNDAVITTLSNLNLKPLESKECEITGFSVPASLKKPTQFILTLTVPNDEKQEDNEVDFLLGCSDVYVNTDCRISDDRTWLDIDIWNNTTYESSGKVVVHKASEDGEVIYSKAYKGLSADNGYAYSVDLGDYEEEDTKYYVEITTDEQENSIRNNKEFVYIGYGTGIEVKAEEKNIHEVESITLDRDKVSLGIGNTAQLMVKDELGNALERGELLWSSSDKRIASVDQTGLVKAHRTGQAQITAYYGELSYSCTIIVSEGPETQTFTVQLDTQGGGDISPITGITFGSEITIPMNISKLGFIFAGWYTQPVGGERIQSSTMIVTETMTLYAHWIKEDEPVDTENQGDGLWISGLDKTGYSYTGDAIKPAIRVYDQTTLLAEKTDYTISYKNNKNVGEATITVTGKGNYSGKETAAFNILPADLSGDDFSMEAFYVKMGPKAQSPIPELYYMGTKLKHKKDFTIKYANTSSIYAQAGEYSATITGTGNYTGTRDIKLIAVAKITKKTSVSIAKASLTGFEKAFPYTGKPHRQKCTLSVQTSEGKRVLTEGTDYTVRYANNTKAGTATVTYSGKNGYTGKLKKTYKITPYNISDDYGKKINYENFLECIYAKGGSKPKPVITFDEKIMTEDIDYTLSYKNNKTVYSRQTPCVVVTGKGSFKGKITIYFTIKPQNLSKMTLVSCDKVYQNKTGNYKITPKLMDLDGKLLSAGKDFDKNSITYTYEEEVTLEGGVSRKAGDAVEDMDISPAGTQIRVTFGSGTGDNYTGTFMGTYRIVKADIKYAKVVIPNQSYTGKEITLDKSKITVTLSGTTLKPEDYDILQYTDNVKKGKATVTLKGNGNYGGTKTVKFNIGTKGFLWWWRKK